MCTQPLQITHINKVSGIRSTYNVPCGKCAECLKHKQSEFAALAVLEAQVASSMYLVTLTYSNYSVPIAVSSLDSEAKRKYVFAGKSELPMFREMCANVNKSLSTVVYGDQELCPSLCRRDVQLFMKRIRMSYMREFGILPNFRYAGFGEYGSSTFRPHYHLLFYSATQHFMDYFRFSWSQEFGFCDVTPVRRVNQDGSNGFLRAACYISKYIAKPKDIFPFLQNGIAEMPRRFSSLHFGTQTLSVERLKSFIYAKT